MGTNLEKRKPGFVRRVANALLGVAPGVNNVHWKRSLGRERKTYFSFLKNDRVASYRKVAETDKIQAVSTIPTQELQYSLEIGFADPDDPLMKPYVDRAIGLCEMLNQVGHWEQWADDDPMLIGEMKGQVSRCLAYARWLKTGKFDLQLLREAYRQLRIALQRLLDDPSYEWPDLMEALHLSTLLLLEVLGPEGAGLDPPPKRAKAKELPESYFRAIEGLRKSGAKDEGVWRTFAGVFDELRDPKLKVVPGGEIALFRLEWGILFCRGTKPPTFLPTPKEVLAAIGK